jgi:acyl-CoA synthetase (AMP-forming)/AMP-acid ligase II
MAGANCPADLMRRAADEMNMKEIISVYGQTEASPGCTMGEVNEDIDHRVETVGSPFPGVECKVIDPETGEEKTIIVQGHHTETRTEIVEYLEIVDNPENFQRNFFNTSLGYVRRKPYVKGTKEYKDFLSDMLAGMEVGQQIITYTEDLQPNLVQVTQEFLDECKVQYNKDFYGE